MSENMVEGAEIKDQAARDAAARVADYEHGWSSDIEQEYGPKGLSEDTAEHVGLCLAQIVGVRQTF